MEDRSTLMRAGRRPVTPCVNVCTLDADDVCTGCLRTLDEIAAWGGLSADDQWRIVDDLPLRAAARRCASATG